MNVKSLSLQTARKASLAAVLGLALIPTQPTTAEAGLLSCLLGGCNSGSGSTPEAAETGIIHVVYMVGDTFFPQQIHAKAGDTLKFYNLTSGSMKVRATDNSWNTGFLDKNEQYSLIIQPSKTLTFQKSGFFSNYMVGAVTIGATPSAVDYGDLVDYAGNVIGKDGVAIKTADGLGYTLASLGGTLRDVGDGLALGLTDTLGLGNN